MDRDSRAPQSLRWAVSAAASAASGVGVAEFIVRRGAPVAAAEGQLTARIVSPEGRVDFVGRQHAAAGMHGLGAQPAGAGVVLRVLLAEALRGRHGVLVPVAPLRRTAASTRTHELS